jgi:hypothetical protein
MKGRPGTTRMRWWGDGSASGSASSRRYRTSHLIRPPDQLCSQLGTDALVGFYHFLILSTVVLSLTCIFIVSVRINMAKR